MRFNTIFKFNFQSRTMYVGFEVRRNKFHMVIQSRILSINGDPPSLKMLMGKRLTQSERVLWL